MASRDTLLLLPEMQDLYKKFRDAMRMAGIAFVLTCTYRSQAEQDALYAQGRTASGPIVTWTKHSKHCEHKAFDIAVLKNGKITWDGKDYDAPGEIGERIGLQWGGRFSTPDKPHFQMKE